VPHAQNTNLSELRTPALGAGGPRFKSGRPDQIFQRVVSVSVHRSHCTVAEIVETR
jgi:hypothetical protein